MKRIFQLGAILIALCAGMVACGPSEEEVTKPTPVTPVKPDPQPDPEPEQPSTPEEPATGARYYIEFRTGGAHNVKMTKIGTNEYELNLSGEDPYIFSTLFPEDLDEKLTMVEFEYKYTHEIDALQIFYALKGAPSEASSEGYGSQPAASSYKTFKASISHFRRAGWGKAGDCLRFDPGNTGLGKMWVRNFVIREMTPEEKQADDEAQAEEISKEEMAKHLSDYLKKDYPSSVSRVIVTSDDVTIEGTCGGDGTYILAEVTPWQDITEMTEFPYTTQVKDKSFTISLDRIAKGREGIDYDRVFSKWAVVKVEGDRQTLDSHGRYADIVAAKSNPAAVPIRHKKGLAAGNHSRYFQDFDDMDIASITMNVLLNGLVGAEDGGSWKYGGKGYSIGSGWQSIVDQITREASLRNIVVSAIILTPTESAYKDPENTGGYYTMPNLTTARAFNMYAAALEYMASRYNSTNGTHGRIHHWIMHNEVDMGKDWTNMGNQPMMRYLDRYIKSMRICYNIVRQYDQHASILGSYTHNWTQSDGEYAPKLMLEQTVAYSEAEGDFRWGVAYHPYPQDLTRPEFWKNDTRSTVSMDTPYITFKNLEVIDACIRQPQNLYQGKEKRILFLSENGTNSPSYSARDLELQAAGGCWAWKKTEKLEGIDGIQWHNWADNKQEFGLRIGLRAFADGSFRDLDPKPVWYVWQAANSSKEEEVFAPYLKTIGITSWDEIHYKM